MELVLVPQSDNSIPSPDCSLPIARAAQSLISLILRCSANVNMMTVSSACQRLAALPSTSSSFHVKIASRPSLKGQSHHIQHQTCGPICCRASATVSEPTLTNGKTYNLALQGDEQQPCEAGRLNEDGTAFLEEHRIRGYEVGPDQKTTIVTIANLLQVCSFLLGGSCLELLACRRH